MNEKSKRHFSLIQHQSINSNYATSHEINIHKSIPVPYSNPKIIYPSISKPPEVTNVLAAKQLSTSNTTKALVPRDANQFPDYNLKPFHSKDIEPAFEAALVSAADVYDLLNPRETRNMTYKEKITNWLSTIPFAHDEFNQVRIDCFPGIVTNPDSETTLSATDIDLGDIDDILELQAQKITKYVSRLYVMEGKKIPNEMDTEGEDEDEVDEEEEEDYYDDEIDDCGAV